MSKSDVRSESAIFEGTVDFKVTSLLKECEYLAESDGFSVSDIWRDSLQISDSIGYSESDKYQLSNLMSDTASLMRTRSLDNSLMITATAGVSESGEFGSSVFHSASQEVMTKTDAGFSVTGMMDQTREHSVSDLNAASRTFAQSGLVKKSNSFSETLSFTMGTPFETTGTERPDSMVSPDKTPISKTGYFLSIVLLASTGIAFWIRCAYMESVLMDLLQAAPGWEDEN
jgi:hypothetical protein